MIDQAAVSQRQRVAHLFYEGEVHIWGEDLENDAQLYIHLIDGPNDFGDDLGEYLLFLLGPGRATNPGGGQNRMVKRLRIVIDDLEADGQAPERREVDGEPNLELAALIKETAAIHGGLPAAALARIREQWRRRYQDAIAGARVAYFNAATYELLTAQAERRESGA